MSESLQTQWQRMGYVVVRNLFDPSRTARLLGLADEILRQWRLENPETGKPGGTPSATVMRHLNHPGYFRQQPARLEDVLSAVADPQVLAIARTILGEEPLFRCTSCFFNPLENSRDGDWHRDSQFGTPDPEAEKQILAQLSHSGTSIQMQIALTASDDVEVIPGSHLRWDTPAEYAIRKADGGQNNRSNEMPGALRLALNAGDAALFNPYGIHRGRYHTERLRRTLMFTYTKTSAPYRDYFSNQPWFLEPGYMESLRPATRTFYEPFVAMYRDFWLEKAD